MFHRTGRRSPGFTLIELAIVLGVAGLLFGGLWRLLSGGNQQLRDQSAAAQQTQLISAVKTFLASNDGQTFMTANPACTGAVTTAPNKACGASANFALPLPPAAHPPDGATNTDCMTNGYPSGLANNVSAFCKYLPAGFTASTTDSYGQVYNIAVLRDSTASGPPVTYSFMILTSGGDTIPDSSGGRIAAMIGGDGGFVYSNNVCNAANTTWACGAYGAWSATVTSYGLAAPASGGYIASRSYYMPEQNSTTQWLSRLYMSGDTLHYTFNTMSVPEYIGGHDLILGSYADVSPNVPPPGNNIYMGDFNAAAPPANGGTIYLQGGAITGSGKSSIGLTGDSTTINSLISLVNTATCTMTAPNTPASCPYALQTTTANVTNLLQASALYAGTFIYNSAAGSSDLRMKENVHPVNNSLNSIMRLRPVSFDFKATRQTSMGVIAQDVEKVYPQLVVKGVDGMKAVNYDGLIAPLIDSVQELKKENDELRQQISDEREHQEKLERELNQLKQ